MPFLAARLNRIKPSPTMWMTDRARALKAAGRDIISMSVGEPDFDTPDSVKAAAIEAIRKGDTKYTAVDGTAALKAAICAKFERENQLPYRPGNITVGAGGKQILYNALMATLEEGDEVLIPAPYWVSYPDMAALAGGTPVILPCHEETRFKLLPAVLEAGITPRTKWLILNSPSNPTGMGYTRAEIHALAECLLSHPQVWVMSDDIYEHLGYDDWSFSAIAEVEPRLIERTLTVNGVSKAYAMTGWRIGYAGGPEALIRSMAIVQSQSTSNPCSISQAAALAALAGGLSFLDERKAIFRARRDFCVDFLNETPGLTCMKPDGAFYLYVGCAGVIGKKTSRGQPIETDTEFVEALLEAQGVAAVPGAAFGLEPYFRLSYATSSALVETACHRIRQFCQSLR